MYAETTIHKLNMHVSVCTHVLKTDIIDAMLLNY